MSLEPEYHFIKGKGWVACTNTFTTTDKRIVRLEFREPKANEYYLCRSKGYFATEAEYTADFETRIICRRLDDCNFRYAGDVNDKDYNYVTVVPL